MVGLGLLWNLGQPSQLLSTRRTNGPTIPPHTAIARCQVLDNVNYLRGTNALTHFINSCLTRGSCRSSALSLAQRQASVVVGTAWLTSRARWCWCSLAKSSSGRREPIMHVGGGIQSEQLQRFTSSYFDSRLKPRPRVLSPRLPSMSENSSPNAEMSSY